MGLPASHPPGTRRPRAPPPDRQPGEREVPRVPLRHDRAVLASAVVREKLRTTTAVRNRGSDAAAHQQAALPEQMLARQDPDLDPGPGPSADPRP
ncbi:hypothetical protein [Streptomyces sp. NPDC054786]